MMLPDLSVTFPALDVAYDCALLFCKADNVSAADHERSCQRTEFATILYFRLI